MAPLKIVFAGTPEFAKIALSRLFQTPLKILAVYTQPDKPVGRGQHLQKSPVKEFALEHHLPIYQPLTLRNQETQQTLKALQPDLIVVAAYGLLLPDTVLSIAKFGCINIHASLLPRWRGAAPIQRAIMAGDTQTGITIMQMDAGLDTGDILLQMPCEIRPDDTTAILLDRLAEIGACAIIEAIQALANQSLHPRPQNVALACHAPKIHKTEALINWEDTAIQLDRNIRAFIPWPIAYSYLDNELVRIWKARPLATKTDKMPGTIIATTPNSINIATGEGVLALEKLQFAGGKPLDVATILHSKSKKFTSGKWFG